MGTEALLNNAGNSSTVSIICDAVPFGFGPMGKLISIINKIKKPANYCLMNKGTSKILAEISEVPFNFSGNSAEPSVYLNVMNPESIENYRKNRPVIFVDSLFWMWDSISPKAANADWYFIQNFGGVREQLTRFKHLIKNPVIVGPIIETVNKAVKKKPQVLVHLGGMESPLYKIGFNTNYPKIMLGLILPVLEKSKFEKIIIAGNGKVLDSLKGEIKTSKKIILRGFGHKEFLKTLAESRLFITSPGLTATFEAFAHKIPTIFLPPQNYSQWNNLKYLRSGKAASCSFHWQDCYSMELPPGLPEEKSVKKVLEIISKFEKDDDAQNTFRKWFNKAISMPSQPNLNNQHRYYQNLGENGADAIARVCEAYAAK